MKKHMIHFLQGASVLLPPVLLVWMAVKGTEYTAFLSTAVILLALVPFFWQFETQKMRARDIVPIGVMSVIAALGRALFAPIPSFMPTSAIVAISGMQFGAQAGFLTGALSALASNLFLGQGPWTPWQMYAWGMIGFFGGFFYERGLFRHRIILYLFGFISGILFGWFMNLWHIAGYVRPLTKEAVFAAYAMSAYMDITHGISNVLFLLLLERPWGKKLERLKKKYGICERGNGE